MEHRICCKCGQSKPRDKDHWYYAKGRPSGPCKECRKAAARAAHHADPETSRARSRAYRAANATTLDEKARQKRAENRDEHNARQRAAYAANREARAAYERARRATNPERSREIDRKSKARPEHAANRRAKAAEKRPELAARARAYRMANPEKSRGYDANRYAQPKFRITRALNAHVRRHLSAVGATKSADRRLITGWSVAELIAHLTPLLEDGMTIENWGEWQIDHIIPIAKVSFESEDDPAFKAAWSLDNLAPLWAFDNNQKHDRLDWVLPETYANPLLRAMYDEPACSYLVAA